jgi:hypothetical protein
MEHLLEQSSFGELVYLLVGAYRPQFNRLVV